MRLLRRPPAIIRQILWPWLRFWRTLPGNARGACWILLMAFLAACMGALIKYVGQRISVFEILFIRQLIVVVILTPVILRVGRGIFETKLLRFHVIRGTCASIAMATGFTALVHLPLAEVTAISFAKTLFMTVLAIIFLGETVGIRRWTVTIVGFLGVLIIVRPSPDAVNIYAILALVSSLFVASVTIVMRKLSQVDPPSTIMAYQSCFVTAIMAGPAIYYWVTPTLQEFGIILIIGGLMWCMQSTMIQGLKAAEAVAVAPVEYARLLFATIIGMIFFAEVPTLWTGVGAGIIIASTLYTIRRNATMKRQSGLTP